MESPGVTAGSSPSPSERLAAGQIPIDAHRLWRPPLPDDGGDLAFFAWVDEHQCLAAEAVEVLFDDTADEQRCDAGVEGVASLEQRGKRGCGGQRMSGGDAARRPGDGRT